jgi:hypothetical protein
MVLLTHIIIALSSVIFASYVMMRPSQAKFYASYGLVAATLVSGTVLTVQNSSHLLQACASGLVYVSVVTALTVLAQKKFATERA